MSSSPTTTLVRVASDKDISYVEFFYTDGSSEKRASDDDVFGKDKTFAAEDVTSDPCENKEEGTARFGVARLSLGSDDRGSVSVGAAESEVTCDGDGEQ